MRSLEDEVVVPELSYIVAQGSAGSALAAIQARVTLMPQPQVDVTELELIRKVREGDKEAFYGLVRPYERAVFFAARSVLNNDADAEDAAQEAALKAFMHIEEFRGESKFSTWLVQIAINEARMKLRKEHRELYESLDESTADEQGDYWPKDFADWREIPIEALQRKELREALSKALASLEPKYRQVVVLRYIQHFSVAETAEALGISEQNVRTRLHRARLHLRDALAPGSGSAWIRGRERVRPSEAVRLGADMTVIEISCVEVWREISNYLEGSVDPELRARMEAHFAVCSNCKAVLDGTKNVVKLIGDGQAFDAPAGFSVRLFNKLP
jgi:RNA polymerase sigma-70 factor, ECF subfamily